MSVEVRQDTPERQAQVESAIRFVGQIRQLWMRVGTKSGRPSKGPTWMAVTECWHCGTIQTTTTKRTKGERWTCLDYGGMGVTSGGYYGPLKCGGYRHPVWWDGPLPDIEDIKDEWASYMASRQKGYARHGIG